MSTSPKKSQKSSTPETPEVKPQAETPKPQRPMSMRDRALAKSKAAFWDPEPSDNVEGDVILIETNKGAYHSTHFHVRKDDGVVVIVSAPDKSTLGKKLAGEHV
jgi:hypothetical protein